MHNAGFIASATACISCHSQPQGARPAVVNLDGSGGHHFAGGLGMSDADCVTCHETTQHMAGVVRLWADPNNPVTPLPLTGTPAELDSFCASCHDTLTHPTLHTTGAAWAPSCVECHELHDPANNNLSLIDDLVNSAPVVFSATTGPGSFDDGDPAANDGICQVCHTTTIYHRANGSGTAHNEGADCTTCHPHADGFMPTAGSCSDCHSTAQGARRAVMGDFALSSHHLQGASVNDADCVVCHEMSQHQQGQVRLKNADAPTDPSAVVALGDDPATVKTEAIKLEAFCLACHDANGAGGTAPFTDGIMPAPVDATLWTSSSHKTGTMTCFGDGDTFGCHASGHGSAKKMLLAPADASQTPVAGDSLREEEGMCYSCHDADGPATTNVEAMFSLSTHHNVSSLEQADGSKVECLNCHNPHTASAAAKLVNPDNGTVWTGTGPEFCLACHDGAPPAGVTFPAGSPGTGYDKSAFVGTTHATALGGNTCRHCHLDHGSQWRSMLRERYEVADVTTYAAAKYNLCWQCHDEPTTSDGNTQIAFKNKHAKHLFGADAPCNTCHNVHNPYDAGEPGYINLEFAVQNGYDIILDDGQGNTYTQSSTFWVDNSQNPPLGNCGLTCHGKQHKPKNYDRTPNPIVDCSACHVGTPIP